MARGNSRRRDRIALTLMLVAALGAISSFVFSVGPSLAADPGVQVVEVWRSYGYLVFAGIFVLLAFRPRRYPGVWELAIFHKVALTISATTLMSGSAGATTVLVADGVVSVLLAASYLLARGIYELGYAFHVFLRTRSQFSWASFASSSSP